MSARSASLAVVAAIGLLTATAGMSADAAERQVPFARQQIELSFAPLVKKVAPAVVNIYTKRVVRTARSPFFNDPFFRQFFGDDVFNFGVPRKRIQNSLGSGVIVRPDGVIVTNNHVIDKADQITVVLADRREFEAKVILADKRSDLAVLRIDTHGEKLPYLEFHDSNDLEVGDLVLAIGNPFGVGQTVTSGIISAVARAAEGISDYSFFIQTDAAINPGNSGGALVSMDGRLAGINTAIYSQSGGSLGIGFAIPSNMVARVLESALNGAKVVRPWFGAGVQELTAELASSLGLNRPAGVIVSEVYPNGPAARAGLKPGDIVLAINGHEVDDPRALRFRIASLPLKNAAALRVRRDGRTFEAKLPIESPPKNPPADATTIDGNNPFGGAKIANLSPALAEKLGVDPMRRGVIVLSIDGHGPAARIGLHPGDMIVKVNGHDIGSVSALRKALHRSAKRWALAVRRGGKVLTVTVEG